MSKAILVIDMPDSCDDCDFCYYSDGRVPICFYKSWVIDEPKAKPDWCPLKPTPEKDEEYHLLEWSAGYKKGWNDCVNYVVSE